MIRRQQQQRNRSAFTLMEIIVVVAIILILASAGVFVYMGILADTDINRAKMDIRNIEAAVQTYYVKKRYYPQDLYTLTERDTETQSAALLRIEALKDPWGKEYNYDPQQTNPRTDVPLIWSEGPPNKNEPIRNWVD